MRIVVQCFFACQLPHPENGKCFVTLLGGDLFLHFTMRSSAERVTGQVQRAGQE